MGKRHLGTRAVLIALTAVVAVLGVAAAGVLFLPTRTVSGQVVDGVTGQPLAGAVLEVSGEKVQVREDGSFTLKGLRFGTPITADALGYQAVSTAVALSNQVRLALSPHILEGVAMDTATRKPVAGAQLSAGTLTAQTDPQGRFRLEGLEPGTEVAARADGYAPTSFKYDGRAGSDLSLKPNTLVVKVVHQYSGQPIEGAEIGDGRDTVRSDGTGQAQLQYLREGAELRVKLDGFAPAKLTYSGQGTAEALLRPDTVTGTVKDSRGKPVAGATVSDGNSQVTTDEQGNFKLSGVAENAKLTVSASGFERKQAEVGQNSSVDLALGPFAAKGLYLTYYGVGDDGLRDHVLELADKTEVNAVVIDVKGDRGWLVYPSSVPMVKEIGAQQDVQIKDPKKFLADLRQRGVYTIARIVAFKDTPLSTARPDLAVMAANTGRPWVDLEGLTWVDPTREEVWDYNIALAVEAIENGFDEVQFDYVRFPTDAGAGNSLDSIRFSTPNNMANRTAAINGFLERAKQAIKARGGNLSADIFGYVVWREDDMGIGQHLESLAQHLDYVSPMVYPTLFWDGLLTEGGEKYANSQAGFYPYEIVHESMKVAAQRIGPEKLRPWLQYYNDYINGKNYTAADMEAQKQATYDAGITGWLFWDPSNRFVKGGFDPE